MEEGDLVTVDIEDGALTLNVDGAELERRRAAWQPPAPKHDHGVLAKYARLVSSARQGGVCSMTNARKTTGGAASGCCNGQPAAQGGQGVTKPGATAAAKGAPRGLGSKTPKQGRRMTGAEAVVASLEAEGVDLVFGYPGGQAIKIYDALYDSTQIRHVLSRHEQGAVHEADGYARATGNVGVAIVTSGPGATNTVTGIATAYMDSVPLVVITGQVPRGVIGTDSFQESDIVGITMPVVKHSYLLQTVDELHGHVPRGVPYRQNGPPRPRAHRRAERPGERPRHVRVPRRRGPALVQAHLPRQREAGQAGGSAHQAGRAPRALRGGRRRVFRRQRSSSRRWPS